MDYYSNENKKKPVAWNVDETEIFLEIIKELQVINLMDGKKFKISEIFKKVEEKMKTLGYTRTHAQLLDKFRAMKKRYVATTKALSISGAGTEAKAGCPYFDKLDEMFGHRPAMNYSGVDSTVLPSNSDHETSGYCESDAEVSSVLSKHSSGSQKRKFVECTSGHSDPLPSMSRYNQTSSCGLSSPSPSTSSTDKKSSCSRVQTPCAPLSPTYSCSSEDRSSSSTPSQNIRRLDGYDEPCVFSKKYKTSKTLMYPKREAPRSGLKNVMHEFAEKIIESQEKLFSKTIEEQRKLDKAMLDQCNEIFLQQTQMLLTGLQNLNVPLTNNYSASHVFPGVSTMPPSNSMIFKESIQRKPYPTPPCFTNQYDNIAYPSTSAYQETYMHTKPAEPEKVIQEFTKMPPPDSISSKKSLPLEPLGKSIHPPPIYKSTCHESVMPQSEMPSRSIHEEGNSSEIEYEDTEYLDDDLSD